MKNINIKPLALVLTTLTILMHSAIGQEKKLTGRIMSDGENIDFAYLLNTRTQQGAESNNGGQFSINAMAGDTLKFRCLGYSDTTFVLLQIPNNAANFEVRKQSIALQEVEVRWFYSYAAFKYAFLNLKLDDKDKPRKFDVKIDPRELGINQKLAAGGVGFSIPMASLVGLGMRYLTNDQQRSIELAAHEKKMERYDALISHDNIREFTRLNGQALDSFIVYLRTRCKISPTLSEYDMMAAVKLAYTDFLAMQDIKVDSAKIK